MLSLGGLNSALHQSSHQTVVCSDYCSKGTPDRVGGCEVHPTFLVQ